MLQHNAIIRTEDTTIANKDKSVTEIHFTFNRKIRFLPVSIHVNFPNLRYYAASQCIVEKVQKSNFEKLEDLIEIDLSENRIHTITSDTFECLRKLEIISLCKFRFREKFIFLKYFCLSQREIISKS